MCLCAKKCVQQVAFASTSIPVIMRQQIDNVVKQPFTFQSRPGGPLKGQSWSTDLRKQLLIALICKLTCLRSKTDGQQVQGTWQSSDLLSREMSHESC